MLAATQMSASQFLYFRQGLKFGIIFCLNKKAIERPKRLKNVSVLWNKSMRSQVDRKAQAQKNVIAKKEVIFLLDFCQIGPLLNSPPLGR